ncbi:Xyloside xylosyltransferase 1 [Halotydeus destructor]|nr:Xyloside xylosyltransferase 1 [Halotydeus destructor]
MHCKLLKSLTCLCLTILVTLSLYWFHSLPEVHRKPKLTETTNYGVVHVAIGLVLPDDRVQAEKLVSKFKRALDSILNHGVNVRIELHLITDQVNNTDISFYLNTKVPKHENFHFIVYDIKKVIKSLEEIMPELRNNFGLRGDVYYMSLGLHHYFGQVEKMILLDADVHFTANIKQLYAYFDVFDEQQVIGVTHEQQPVYGNLFDEYRQSTDNASSAGLPLPTGNPGVNSGVMLLYLSRLRLNSSLDKYLNKETISNLTEQYHFRGHLGDQDLYTLMSLKEKQIFKIIPCTWNRQLCKWWRYHGHSELPFEAYNKCSGKIKLYHGNCNSVIPANVK